MFINDKSLGMQGLDPLSILKKKPAGTEEGPPKLPDLGGALKLPQEKLNMSETKKGTAQLLFKDDLKAMRENWVSASKSGKPISSISDAIKNGKSPTVAVYEYMKTQGYSKEQMSNVADFMEEAMKHGAVKDSKDENLIGRKLGDVLAIGLKEKGITEKQVETIANGDFSVSAYVSLVKDGQPIA
jgi:hypothetical protein